MIEVIYTLWVLSLGVALAWVIGEFGRIYYERKTHRQLMKWSAGDLRRFRNPYGPW